MASDPDVLGAAAARALCDNVAASLSPLQSQALAALRARRPCPVADYLALRADALRLDLESLEAVGFRRRFNGYYGVRRNAAWRAVFYRTFNAAKDSRLHRRALFAEVLATLEAATGRVEASFASKLVALLRPEGPIIDSIIRGFLSCLGETPRFGDGAARALAYYGWLDTLMSQLVETAPAAAWAATFDEAFSHLPGVAEIHRAKKVDFLIWAGAVRAWDRGGESLPVSPRVASSDPFIVEGGNAPKWGRLGRRAGPDITGSDDVCGDQ